MIISVPQSDHYHSHMLCKMQIHVVQLFVCYSLHSLMRSYIYEYAWTVTHKLWSVFFLFDVSRRQNNVG